MLSTLSSLVGLTTRLHETMRDDRLAPTMAQTPNQFSEPHGAGSWSISGGCNPAVQQPLANAWLGTRLIAASEPGCVRSASAQPRSLPTQRSGRTPLRRAHALLMFRCQLSQTGIRQSPDGQSGPHPRHDETERIGSGPCARERVLSVRLSRFPCNLLDVSSRTPEIHGGQFVNPGKAALARPEEVIVGSKANFSKPYSVIACFGSPNA